MSELAVTGPPSGAIEVSTKKPLPADKYRGIKFVERKKVLRLIKSTMAQVREAVSQSGETSALETRLSDLKDKLQYIDMFPRCKKYISLFPPQPLSEEGLERQARILQYIKWQTKRGVSGQSFRPRRDNFLNPVVRNGPVNGVGARSREPSVKKSKDVSSREYSGPTNAQAVKVKKVLTGVEHPSWAAKRAMTSNVTTASAAGSHMRFSDDDE